MNWINKLKCKLGFHDNKVIGEDLCFMPHVRVLMGSCCRCGEPHNFTMFIKSGKVVSTNSGIEKLFFGKYNIMPLEEGEQK